jgi:hypothetical protein
VQSRIGRWARCYPPWRAITGPGLRTLSLLRALSGRRLDPSSPELCQNSPWNGATATRLRMHDVPPYPLIERGPTLHRIQLVPLSVWCDAHAGCPPASPWSVLGASPFFGLGCREAGITRRDPWPPTRRNDTPIPDADTVWVASRSPHSSAARSCLEVTDHVGANSFSGSQAGGDGRPSRR